MEINFKEIENKSLFFRSTLKTSIQQEFEVISENFVCSAKLGRKLQSSGITNTEKISREDLKKIYHYL